MHVRSGHDNRTIIIIFTVPPGRHPYPGPYQDNAIWMMGNPNWATITMHLGEVNERKTNVHIIIFYICN